MNDDKQPVAWKLVPVEPTWEMVIAACPPGETVDHFSIKEALRAALAASPAHTESAAPVDARKLAVWYGSMARAMARATGPRFSIEAILAKASRSIVLNILIACATKPTACAG